MVDLQFISLLSLIPLILCSTSTSTPPSSPPSSLNLLDLLSESPNHTILVRLYQRTRLIPTLNQLQFRAHVDDHGITILAPTDHAIRQKAMNQRSIRQKESGKRYGELAQGSQSEVGRVNRFKAEYLDVTAAINPPTSIYAQSNPEDSLGIWEWAIQMLESGSSEDSEMKLIWRPSSPSTSSIILPTQHENIHALLRQELLYHVLNFTLPLNSSTISPSNSKPNMISTLHLPSRRLLFDPTRPGDEPHPQPHPFPPSNPPHPGDEDMGGLLGGEGQKLFWNSRTSKKVEDEKEESYDNYFGTDSKGNGGVKMRENGVIRSKGYGEIVELDGVLELPPPLETLIHTHPSLSHLSSLFSTLPNLLSTFSTSSHLTLFLPTSDSFNSDLTQMERTYLEGNWSISNRDKMKFLGWHSSSRGVNGIGRVGYSTRIRQLLDKKESEEDKALEITTILGGKIWLENDSDEGLRIVSSNPTSTSSLTSDFYSLSNSAKESRILEQDLLTENGVVHVVSNLILPEKALSLNVEKTLLALNGSRFVDMIYKAGLETYINWEVEDPVDGDEPSEPQPPSKTPSFTFFVPQNDAIEDWLKLHQSPDLLSSNQDDLPSKSKELEDLMKYHIAPTQLKREHLRDSMLVGTELRDWKLKMGRQRIRVEVDEKREVDDDDFELGDRKKKKDRDGRAEIGFGDANVLAEPVIVGDSIIYLISQLLTPPANPIQVAVSTLSLSTFVAACSVSDLVSMLKRAPGITLLIPHNDAFTSLGLVMPYLLLAEEQPRKELRSLVEYHAVDRVVYRDDFEEITYEDKVLGGGKSYPTLEGSEIWAGRSKNGSIEIKRGSNAGGNDGKVAKIIKTDRLTSSGVIHEIDSVQLPPTLDLTIGKLMKGASASTMASLVRKAGYEYILNGTLPQDQDEESKALDDELRGLKAGGSGDRKGKRKRNPRKDHKKRHKMFRDLTQAYTILTPTDQAFTRINLTYYLSNPEELKKLVQLHIIPSPAGEVLPTSSNQPNLPINVKDEKTFTTLLDRSIGGQSKYGKLAFRKSQSGLVYGNGDENENPEERLGWIVGIKNSRGGGAEDRNEYSANLISFGRESPAILVDDSSDLFKASKAGKRRGKNPRPGENWNSKNIGGILTIDSVLQPYEPGWFFRWGYVVLYISVAALVMAGLGFSLWSFWSRDGRIRLPEAMEGEEE